MVAAMPPPPWVRHLLTLAAAVVLAAPLWAVLGYLATAPLGMLFGWSGHPPLPGAPTWVYVAVYAGVLPVVSLGAAWGAVQGVRRLASRRPRSGGAAR
jgi:hypothetical protein